MRKVFSLLLLLYLMTGYAYSADPPFIKDKQDEINYSLGHQLGLLLLEKGIEFRAQVLWQGVHDGANDADPFMPKEQMNLILQELTPEAPAASPQVSSEPAASEKTFRLKGEEYLAKIAKNQSIKSLPGGVKYKVIKTGEGDQPQATDSVMVSYLAKTIEDFVFDSTFPEGIKTPVEMKVDKVIPGLAEALQAMKVGDQWEIYIPTRMAFRDSGPMAGQTVIYNIELLEILPEFR